jgi:hypothetical protein
VKNLLQELAEAKWTEPICKAFAPHAWQDLRQELFLLIADNEATQAKAQRSYEAGCLEYFYIKCAKNLTGKGGKVTRYFHPLNNKALDVYQLDTPCEESEPIPDEVPKLEAISIAYEQLGWYEAGLVQLHYGGMSIREIYRRTRITDKEVQRVIRLFKQHVINAKAPPKQGQSADDESLQS